jgi:GTP-binding protein YchF
MGFKCGIIGLPNVGKSTIFSALTSKQVEASNYPFCTIEPNIGIVNVVDERIIKISEIIKPEKVIFPIMEFVDIAGLVKGASKGEGLGNKFLANIRNVDAIAHVVRCFNDNNITHVEGEIDPVRDIEIINLELILADLETVEKRLIKTEKNLKTGDKQIKKDYETLLSLKELLEKEKPARLFQIKNEEEEQLIRTLNLLTLKPVLYIANIGEDNDDLSEYVQAVENFSKKENSKFLKISGKLEKEIAQFDNEDEKREFMEEMGIKISGLDLMIKQGYDLLSLITYITAGKPEVKGWTIKKGTKAPQAAGKIHTDFERGFIKAEVISYADYIKAGSEAKAKELGLLRLEGKEYVVQDGDIIHFRFNV